MKRVAPVSVAIATLNRPTALARCLDALLSGDVLPAEVIVVDQGQAEQTAAVLASRRDSPIAFVHLPQRRRGLSIARNAAVAVAGCPILAITDDDCVPDHGWIAVIEQAFGKPDAPDVVTGRVLPLGPARTGFYAVSLRESSRGTTVQGKAIPWLLGTGGNCAFKRDWLARVGGYDEHLGAGSKGQAGEDADLFYRLLCAGAEVQYEPAAIVYHERQSKAHRRDSRWRYGHGIGALCGISLGRGDLYALQMLGDWVFQQGWGFAGALRRRQGWEAYTRLLSLAGTAPGFVYGLAHVRRI